MTIKDDGLELKKSRNKFIKIFIETYKIDVLCDKIEKTI